jgi:hypothetical protein
VRVLRPGSGAAKPDVVVDEAKVEELMGVAPAKVVDVMALMGDSIDNIPGAKGIGEKGAREIIRRFGSAEAALDAADKVENKRYREALQNSRDQVLLSKQLAQIACDAPITLALDQLERREPDANALRELYTELGFTSLLKELPASVTAASATQDSERLDSAAAIGKFLAGVPKEKEIAVWIEPAPGEREAEGFGTRIAAIELSPDRKSYTIRNSSSFWPVPSQEFATPPCSIPICCGPPPENTISPASFCGIATSRCRARRANAPINCSTWRRCSPKKSSAPASPKFIARSICR